MTNGKSKRRQINFKLRMCFLLNWYLKTPVSPPVFYFKIRNKKEVLAISNIRVLISSRIALKIFTNNEFIVLL